MKTTSAALIVLLLVVGVPAVPWTRDVVPTCSTECPVAGSPKLSYVPEKTYSYEYLVDSMIELLGVEDGVTQTGWSARVEVTWSTPCDMAIILKDYKVDGDEGPPAATFLERYPLVVAVSDGRVHHVCSHPDDDVWSINLKKGVASAFQNSLPSLSTVNSGQNFSETDVVGKCSTRYMVEDEEGSVVVRKTKDHRMCQERYPTPAETHVPWLKGPLPVEESRSVCEQEIKNGIYWSVKCEDKNVIRPSYGAYKYVVATQESTIRLLPDCQLPPTNSTVSQGRMVQASLRYSYDAPKKDPSLVSKLDHIMTQICDKTRESVQRDAASLMAEAVHLLRRVPEEAVEQTLEKIRKKQYCADYTRLENLFLDAIAFVHESGSLKVIVRELTARHATGRRALLYSAALYLHPRPTFRDMEVLLPVFEFPQASSSVTLAAASMVNNYCRRNPKCEEEVPVWRVAEALNNQLLSQCSPFSGDEVRESALTTLKAMGNMGVMTPEEATSAIRCIRTEEVGNHVRVAAAQAFRQARCKQPNVKHLVNIAVDPVLNTEVRIASYLAAVRCAQKGDLEIIIANVSKEENTQVRGFILSHLLNLQETNAPHKEYLRYLLRNVTLPRNFTSDFRKYSRNLDLSHFAPWLGVGVDLQSNVIYDVGSFVPRSIDVSLNAALEGTFMNIGEVGLRFEGLETVIKKVFGPTGYLQKTSLVKILQDLFAYLERENESLVHQLQYTPRPKRSHVLSFLSNLFNEIYYSGSSDSVRADVFARLMGQEVHFASMSSNLRDIRGTSLSGLVVSYVTELLQRMKNVNTNSARTAQLFLDYSLPTTQGTPLKLQLEGTAVCGLSVKGNLTGNFLKLEDKKESVAIIPSASVEVRGFVGYDSSLSRAGIKMMTTVSSTSGGISLAVKAKNDTEFELYWKLPEKMDLIDVNSETYLMKGVRGEPDTKITPASMKDIRIKSHSCVSSFDPVLDLSFCYDLDAPDIFRSNFLPLGGPTVARVYIKKSDPSLKGFNMTASVLSQEGGSVVSIKVETSGSTTPKESEVTLLYIQEGDESYVASATLESSFVSSVVSTTVRNSEHHKSVEGYASFSSNSTEMSRGVKMDFRKISTRSNKEYQVHVYSNKRRNFPLDSQILESKFVKKVINSETSIDLLCRTNNALKDYLDLRFEVGTDLWYPPASVIPLPTNLRKFELHGGLGGWSVTSSVRKTNGSGVTSEYSSVFKVTRRQEDLISAGATFTTKGRPDHNFVAQTKAEVKLGSVKFKAASAVHYEDVRIGGFMQAHGSSGKVVEVAAFFTHTGKPYTVEALVDVPRYMKPVKIQGNFELEDEDRLLVEVGVKHGESVVLQIFGPLTGVVSITTLQIKVEFMVTTVSSGAHRVSSTILITNNTLGFTIQLKTHQDPVFTVEWTTSSISSYETIAEAVFILPDLIDFRTDLVFNDGFVYNSFNILLFPKSSAPRKVKGFANLDLDDQNIRVDLWWDADRDVEQRIIADVTLFNSAHPNQSSIRGSVQHGPDTYHINFEVVSAYMLDYVFSQRSFFLSLETPIRTTYIIDFRTTVEKKSTSVLREISLNYKNMEGQEYVFFFAVRVDEVKGPDNYRVETQFSFTPPDGQTSTVSTEVKHQRTPWEQGLYLVGMAQVPTLKNPLVVKFTSSNRRNSYIVDCTAKMNSSAPLFTIDFKTYPIGGIRSFDIGVDMVVIRDFFNAVVRALDPGGKFCSSTFCVVDESHSREYRYRYHKPSHSAYSMLLRYPSRTVQAEASYSPSHASLTFYPNKDESEAKYRVGVQASHSYWDQQSSYQGHLSHPTLTRDVRVEVQVGGHGDNLTGTFELDVFPDTRDKILGKLNSTRISNNSVRTEALITCRLLSFVPQVTLVTADAPHTVGFDVEFRRTTESEVSFSMAARYDQNYAEEATLAFLIKTEEQGPVLDVSGVVEPVEVPECRGLKIRAVAHTLLFGNFDVNTKVCKSVFIEIASHNRSARNVYTARFGRRTPTSVEASVSVYDLDQRQRHDIIMARGRVVPGVILEVDEAYEKKEFQTLQKDVFEKWQLLRNSTSSCVARAYRCVVEEAREHNVTFPPPPLRMLARQIILDLGEIRDDLLQHGLIPLREYLTRVLESPVTSHVAQVSYNTWLVVRSIQQQLPTRVARPYQEHQDWKEEVKGFNHLLREAAVKVVQTIQTGDLRGTLRHLLEKLEHTRIFQLLKTDIDALWEQYPEEYEAVKQVASKFSETLESDVDVLRESPNLLWVLKLIFANINSVVKEVTLNPATLLQNIMWASGSSIGRPTDNIMEVFYALHPIRIGYLLPPFSSTALIIGRTEILTFDGNRLRVPISPCEVLLTVYGASKLTMAHPDPKSPPQITFTSAATTITILPDFSVEVNGRVITDSDVTIGDVSVQKTYLQVKVISPFMTVRESTAESVVSLEVSGWTFGHLAGLLGTYDGEAGNDWLMPTGARASSLQQLVRSWQEDQQCQTPTISPVSPVHTTVERIARCHPLLGMWSRCNAVVPSAPFLSLCYVTTSPCDAAQAYRTMCAARGIGPLFPRGC
ncbi:vitellogenin-like [Panulirus ornatus]|uniref:vitellogenin-like n=1 Tax=Panulirus ornatus TaxID=150431 RepID=UPI003A83E659